MRHAARCLPYTRKLMASHDPGASPGPAAYQPGPIPYPARPAFGSGGSFLGTAASSAAGVIGGALLLDGIRSMSSHRSDFGGSDQTAFAGLGDRNPPLGKQRVRQ